MEAPPPQQKSPATVVFPRSNSRYTARVRLVPRLGRYTAPMATSLSTVLRESGRRPSLAIRAAAIAMLLYIEKVVLVLINADSMSAGQGLGGAFLVAERWTSRFLLAFSVALALLSYVRGNDRLKELNQAVRETPLRPQWLLLQAALVLPLAPLTSSVLGGHSLELPAVALVLLWCLFALGALLAAFTAMAPWVLWRRIAVALGILPLYAAIVALPAASQVYWTQKLWAPTARLTFDLVSRVLSPIVPTLRSDPVELVLTTDRFSVQVTEACSGLEGVGLMLAFCCAWLLCFRKEYIFPRALILIPAGLALIFTLNVVRIATLVLIGHAGYPEVAMYGFHSQAGWIAFICASCLVVFVSHRSSWLNRSAQRGAQIASENPTAVYLLPLIAILAVGTVVHAASPGFETLYALRLIAAVLVLGFYWRKLRTLDWRISWRGPAAGLAVFILWLLAAHFLTVTSAMPPELAAMSPTLRTQWIAARVSAAVITVPIAEELAYRGYLLRRLQASDFESVRFADVRLPAMLLSAVIFGLAHGSMWLAGIAAGWIYALTAKRSGRIGEAVAAHATTNALLATFVLLWNQWQLW